MPTRKYSSRSQQTTLTAGINSSATSATVVSGSALLGGITVSAGEIFTVVIDPDTALEEIVDVTAVSTNTLTIVRGIDGSTGQAHSAGAVVRHMAIGRDYREANTHIENTTTAHGLTLANVTLSTGTGNVSTAMLASNAVTTAKITDLNVTTAKIADSAITSAKIADLTIATGDIADSAITSGKIATGAVGTTKIDDLSVTEGKLAANAVTSAKIADGTIVAGDLADGAVTSAKILDGTIVNADINASAAIDKTKISGTAVTVADTGTVTSTMIANDTIVNADINSSAQIAYGKLNLANSVTNADINASAAIEWTKIAPSSTVSATELGYLDGVTSAVQTQLDAKLATATAASTYAPLASPALTGVPTAPTAASNTNTTQIATTAYVQNEISELIDAAPGALDTLNELAAALGDDANFSTTVTTALGTKLPLAGGTMTGAIAMGTNKITGAGDPTSAQDVATKNYVDTAAIAPSNLTGPITSVGPATSIASQTGTGSTFVMQNSPTLTTPALGVATATSINGTTIPSSKTLVATDSTAYVVPSQTGNSGKYLKTDGSTSSWQTVDSLPSQTGNAGEFLTTDGTTASWAVVAGSLAQPTEPSSPTDGQIWVDTDGTALINQLLRWSKAPANGTTTLSGNDDNSVPLTYSVGYEQVFQNGALLARGSDYTATSGTSITLTNASVTGDIFEVFAAQPVAISDVYTQTQANSAFISKSLTTTTGDIIYASGANTPARLGIGSTGQTLSVSGGVPAWVSPGLTKIMSATFSGVANTGTTFDGVFSSSYNNYVIVFSNLFASGNVNLLFQLRKAGPTTQASAYYGTRLSGNTLATTTNGTSFDLFPCSTESSAGQILLATDATPTQLSYTMFGRQLNQAIIGGFMNDSVGANAATGFILSPSSGTISGFVAVYGLAD